MGKNFTLGDLVKRTGYKNELWDSKMLSRPLEKFDFSDDCNSEKYIKCEDLYEKYKAYKLTLRYKDKAFSLEDLEKDRNTYKVDYDGVIDPDSHSKLLQEIYKVLWDEDVIQSCSGKSKVFGDTMNTLQTTLNEYVWDKYQHQTPHSSLGNCLLNFKGGMDNEDKNALNFFRTSHMLGNFIPMPAVCNGPRGIGKLKDYWDLTLYHIHKYYMERDNICELETIVGAGKAGKCKEWLDAFKCWNGFVEKNYLQPFVNFSQDGKNYEGPIPLWDNHFENESRLIPNNKEDALKYFENAGRMINERSRLMVEELKKRLP